MLDCITKDMNFRKYKIVVPYFGAAYRWFVYKTSYVHFSKFYRRDIKLSWLFAFSYILVRFKLKAYFKFI